MYRAHIEWQILVPYMAGAMLVGVIFALTSWVPPLAIVFLMIGVFPLIGALLPSDINLNILDRRVAFGCGVVVTLAQFLAGASGPVLDVFYVKTRLTRQQVLGTKALTQTLGHLLKLAYYGTLIGVIADEPVPAWWLIGLVVAAAMGGNWAGAKIVLKMTDDQFRVIGRRLIVAISLVYIAKGASELIDLFVKV